MARYTGPDCKRCRREKMKLFLKGAKCDRPEVPDRDPSLPAGRARPRSDQGERVPAADAREAEVRAHLRRAGEAVPRLLRGGQPPARQDRREPAAHPRVAGSTTSSTAPASPSRATWPASWSGTATSLVNGHKVDIPSYRVSENDIVEVRAKSSVELTPFVIARAEAGERTVPAWLEVIPNQMRILVHSLPARQVIDTQVQEQLIVELYSQVIAARSVASRRRDGRHQRPATESRQRPSRRQIAGVRDEKELHRAHRTAPHPDRRVGRRVPLAVRHRAARARLRLHPRQLPAPHPAVLDPGRRRHQHPDRRRAARVHHRSPVSRRTSPSSS